eukprot:2804112-Lingulodinium_polyedra.AAC.1
MAPWGLATHGAAGWPCQSRRAVFRSGALVCAALSGWAVRLTWARVVVANGARCERRNRCLLDA